MGESLWTCPPRRGRGDKRGASSAVATASERVPGHAAAHTRPARCRRLTQDRCGAGSRARSGQSGKSSGEDEPPAPTLPEHDCTLPLLSPASGCLEPSATLPGCSRCHPPAGVPFPAGPALYGTTPLNSAQGEATATWPRGSGPHVHRNGRPGSCPQPASPATTVLERGRRSSPAEQGCGLIRRARKQKRDTEQSTKRVPPPPPARPG